MPYKRSKDFLTRDEVIEKIQNKDPEFRPLKKAKKSDILVVARDLNAISNKQLSDSVEPQYHIVKLYMRSILKSIEYEQKIEDYVLCHSKLFVRATRLQNLAVQSFLGIPSGPISPKRTQLHFQIGENTQEDPAYRPHHLIYNGIYSSYLRQCYLPELVPPIERDVSIQHWLQKRHYELAPPEWMRVMSCSGWNKACDIYASQMRGNLTVTIKKRVLKYAADYVGSLQPDIEEGNLKNLIYKKWPADECLPMGIEDSTKKTIKDVRLVLGMKDSNALPKKLRGKITADLFCFYVHLVKIGLIKRPLLPLSTYGRKFAYIDSQIAQALFTKPDFVKMMDIRTTFSENRLKDIFDFTTSSARCRRRLVQKQRRKRILEKKQRKGAPHKRKKDIKNKKKDQGTLPFVKDIYVSSVMTDGVSICVRVKEPRPLPMSRGRVTKTDPKPPTPEEKLELDLARYRAEDGKPPVFIGVDYGRAKLYTAASQSTEDSKPQTTTFTRRQYYWEIGSVKRARWEQQRRKKTMAVIPTLQLLSWAGRKKDFELRLQVESATRGTLMNEFIHSKDRALWSMMAYRWKRSSLARAANRLIDSVKRENNQRMIIGAGNASFPSTGRGEKAVPTKKFKEHLWKAIFRRQYEARVRQESKPITLLNIDEFRTTKCCSNCEAETTAATITIPGSGKKVVSNRLRLCKSCIPTTGKLCDRDVNAARNILLLTKCKYYGEERPEYLQRPPREDNEAEDTHSLSSSDSEADSSQFSD